MQNGDKKTKWNQPHVLITALDMQEVERRLKNATILRGEWVPWRERENYLFHMGKMRDNTFEIYPNHRRMPPRSERGRGLPKVCGIMSETATGGTGICIWLEEELGSFFIAIEIVFGFLFLFVFVSQFEFGWVLVWLQVGLLYHFIRTKYRAFVSRRVLEWLTQLWEAEE